MLEKVQIISFSIQNKTHESIIKQNNDKNKQLTGHLWRLRVCQLIL